MSPRHEVLAEGCELFMGDMLEILPTLGEFDACVTDPPYGIGAGAMSLGKWRTASMEKMAWDDAAPSDLSFALLKNHTRHQIVWGMNYFTLPPTRRYLVWDKGAGFKGRDFAECELAWCSFDGNARVFSHDPLAKGDYRTKEHPTQKPIELMSWCLDQLPAEVGTILDPFMGSGTTGVAAIKRGKAFYGIEREPKYFDIACRRISEALKSPDLFIPAPAPVAKQESLI
jgi:DNA modification methylase